MTDSLPARRWVPRLVALGVFLAVGFGQSPSVETIERELASGDAARKKRALEVIGKIRRGDLAWKILPYLKDEDPEIRRETLRALARCENAEVVDEIAACLEEKRLRDKAIEALVHLKDSDAIPYLEKLKDDPNPKIKKAAAKGIVELTPWSNQWQVQGPDGKLYGRRSEVYPDTEALFGFADPLKAAAGE